MGTRLGRVADWLRYFGRVLWSGVVRAARWAKRLAVWLWRRVGPTSAVLFVVGTAFIVVALGRLSRGGEPEAQEWPAGRAPGLRVLVGVDADVDDDSVGVDVRYAVDADRLLVGVTACQGHGRIAVVFVRADPDVVQQATATWRLSITDEDDAEAIAADVVQLAERTNVVIVEAPDSGPEAAEAEDTCMHYAMRVAGLGLASSRGGQVLVETPEAKTCGGAFVGTVAADGTIELDGVDGRWRRECTDSIDTHRVRIEANRAQRVVWSSQDAVGQAFDFADEAQVLLADVAELNRIRNRDIAWGIVLGVGATFSAEAIIRVFIALFGGRERARRSEGTS